MDMFQEMVIKLGKNGSLELKGARKELRPGNMEDVVEDANDLYSKPSDAVDSKGREMNRWNWIDSYNDGDYRELSMLLVSADPC